MPINSGEKLDEVILTYVPAATAIIKAIPDFLLECCIIVFNFTCAG